MGKLRQAAALQSTMFTKHSSKKLSAYHHGELAAAEARRVAEHLRNCARCRAEYEEIKFGAQLAAQLARTNAPASLWSELETLLEADSTSKQSGFAQWLPSFTAPRLALAGAALLLACGSFWLYRWFTQPWWAVARVAGAPRIGAQTINDNGRLGLGDSLTTDQSSRARINVGQIGVVEVEPNTQMQLVAARATEHRLELTRGKMKAYIWAPPKLFYVNTPSATAIDLGCQYTLEVDERGEGVLHVTTGWVAFEWRGVESFVPAGAECITRPELGPGTPHFDDAAQTLQTALAQFDNAQNDAAARAAALDTVLAHARLRDSLTLWHLLTRTHGDERARVYDRFAQLIPPPPSVTRAGVLAGDRAMIDAWWDQLGLDSASWWRIWKGPAPSAK